MDTTEKRKISPEHDRRANQGCIVLLIVAGLCVFLFFYTTALFSWPRFNRPVPYVPLLLTYHPVARLVIVLSTAIVLLLLLGFTFRSRSTIAWLGAASLTFLSMVMVATNLIAFAQRPVYFYNEVPAHGKIYRLISASKTARPPADYEVIRCDPEHNTCFHFGIVQLEEQGYVMSDPSAQGEIFVGDDQRIRFRIEGAEYSILSDGVGD